MVSMLWQHITHIVHSCFRWQQWRLPATLIVALRGPGNTNRCLPALHAGVFPEATPRRECIGMCSNPGAEVYMKRRMR
jgi:hypothetical protein